MGDSLDEVIQICPLCDSRQVVSQADFCFDSVCINELADYLCGLNNGSYNNFLINLEMVDEIEFALSIFDEFIRFRVEHKSRQKLFIKVNKLFFTLSEYALLCRDAGCQLVFIEDEFDYIVGMTDTKYYREMVQKWNGVGVLCFLTLKIQLLDSKCMKVIERRLQLFLSDVPMNFVDLSIVEVVSGADPKRIYTDWFEKFYSGKMIILLYKRSIAVQINLLKSIKVIFSMYQYSSRNSKNDLLYLKHAYISSAFSSKLNIRNSPCGVKGYIFLYLLHLLKISQKYRKKNKSYMDKALLPNGIDRDIL